MNLPAWSDFHQRLWQRWPVLVLSGHYGVWLGLLGMVYLGLLEVGWTSIGGIPVILVMLAAAQMIVGYLKRPLTFSEQGWGSLICTLMAAAYLYLAGEVHPPTWRHAVYGFITFLFIHLGLFSPWYLRLLLKARDGSPEPASLTPSRYTCFWTAQPLLATLAHYAVFLLAFALIAYGLFGFHSATGRPLRGFILVMVFVMSWLFALQVKRNPDLKAWLMLACMGAAIYWLIGYAAGAIHPDSPRKVLASVAVTLLYHLLMFSPWLVGFWLRFRPA